MLNNINYNIVERFLSIERLNTYLLLAKFDKNKAFDLYIKNINECQIFYVKLHWLEIGLRNSINYRLSQQYGEGWFDNMNIGFSAKEQAQIHKAKEKLLINKKIINNNNMVAEINFGFWVNLFNYPYEKLWRYCLRKTFVHHTESLERKQLSKILHPILKFRNRIAHYEPIIGYDLKQIEHDIISIVSWIEPDIAELLN